MSDLRAYATTCICCADKFTMHEGLLLMNCPACGTTNERPAAEVTQEELDAFARANELRQARAFAQAERSYERMLDAHSEDHQALWGFLLARYGVEFVVDPVTGEKKPTVHFTSTQPMQQTMEFRKACSLASPERAAEYRRDALYVDRVQAGIRERAKRYPDYDVFLCHKTTRIGEPDVKTLEFEYMRELCGELRRAGYRVFFAPDASLTPGADYEAAIYHALTTSRVMLLACADVAHLNSAWVRSEWLRFLGMMNAGEDKTIVPLWYQGFRADMLPVEFRGYSLQAQDMQKPTAMRGIYKVLEEYFPDQKRKGDDSEDSRFETEEVPGGLRITGYKGEDASLVIPTTLGGQNVVEIGPMAFQGNGDIQSILIRDGVQVIGEAAFEMCMRLHTVIMPHTLRVIGARAFDANMMLRQVSLYKGLERIGEQAFSGCISLERLSLYDTVTEIGAGAFENCTSMREMAIPAGVTTLGEQIFSGCDIKLRVTVDSPAHAYAVREGIGCVVTGVARPMEAAQPKPVRPAPQPEPVRPEPQPEPPHPEPQPESPRPEPQPEPPTPADDGIGLDAMDAIRAAAELLVKQGAGFAEDAEPAHPAGGGAAILPPYTGPVNPESEFDVRGKDGSEYLYYYDGKAERVVMPGTKDGKRIRSISDRAFSSKDLHLRALILPDGLAELSAFALQGNSELEELRLPADIETIGDCALQGCANLRRLVIPATLRTLGTCAMTSCTALEEVVFLGMDTAFGDAVFMGCEKVTIVAPENSTAHKYARDNNHTFRALTAATQPAPVSAPAPQPPRATPAHPAGGGAAILPPYTGPVNPESEFDVRGKDGSEYLYYYDGKAERVVMPGTKDGKRIRSISDRAFSNKDLHLRALILPDGLAELSAFALQGNSELEELRLPADIETIGDCALQGCANLRRLVVPATLKTLGTCAMTSCTALEEVVFLGMDTAFGDAVFMGCEKVTIVAPENSTAHKYARDNNHTFRALTGGGAGGSAASPESDFEVHIKPDRSGYSIKAYRGPGGDVVIPERIQGLPVVGVWEPAFRNDQHIRSILLPRSMRYWGNNLFRNLTDVTIRVYRDSHAHVQVMNSGLHFEVVD